jgi:NAD(P)-dependent dehydrogenase (short-subunit alcohol dehydrogenase family)
MELPEAFKEFSLKGKAALVIGAEHAVGVAAALALAEAGANIVVASQEPGTDDQLNIAAKAAAAAGGKVVQRIQSAVSRADLSATIDLTVKELGKLDILVNAVDFPFYAPAEATDDSAYDRVMEDNFKTVWMACQEGGRAMLHRGGGAIVNISSILAQRGVANASLYCAAKAAVLNLTRALALEWARKNIRLNAIEAGWMDDPSSPAVADAEFRKALLKYLPYHRLLKPEELAGALLYLVCPASGFVTGESIVVDGGLMCRV